MKEFGSKWSARIVIPKAIMKIMIIQPFTSKKENGQCFPFFRLIMAMYEDGEELESKTVSTEIEAIKVFDDLFMKYAEPLQKALYNKLQEGKRYTLVYLNEFGFQ